jgi:hypothetical protein
MTDDYRLSHGKHIDPRIGRCAMEWVAHLAGEPHTDAPRCVSPVLRSLFIALNDQLEDDERPRLRPYLARTIGTADDGHDYERELACRNLVLSRSSELARFSPDWAEAVVSRVLIGYRSVRTAGACTLATRFGQGPHRPLLDADPAHLFETLMPSEMAVKVVSYCDWQTTTELLERLLPLERVEIPDALEPVPTAVTTEEVAACSL